MSCVYGKCGAVGSCNLGCQAFKPKNPPDEKCRWCGHDESEHQIIAIINPDGSSSLLTVEKPDSSKVIVTKEMERKERVIQFHRAHVSQPGNCS